MSRISFWTWRHWGRDGEACKPPSPTAPGFQLARLHGRKEAGNSLAVRSRSCWRRAPCESPAWYHRAPWSWWSSYSKWIWGSGVYCLYFPLFDPQVHGDCWEKETRRRVFSLTQYSSCILQSRICEYIWKKNILFWKNVLNRQKQQELVGIKSCFTQLWCISTWDFLAPVCLSSYEGNKQHEKKSFKSQHEAEKQWNWQNAVKT